MHHLCAGGNWAGYEQTRVRYYVDGEESASVQVPLGLGMGQPFVSSPHAPTPPGPHPTR